MDWKEKNLYPNAFLVPNAKRTRVKLLFPRCLQYDQYASHKSAYHLYCVRGRTTFGDITFKILSYKLKIVKMQP